MVQNPPQFKISLRVWPLELLEIDELGGTIRLNISGRNFRASF